MQEINASGQRVLCRTENFVDFHEGFNKLIRSPQILHFLEHLTGEPMVLFKDKLNYKFAGSGGFSPHIDSTGKRSINYISMLIAIDDTNLQNGCLEFVPGSHQEAIPIGPDNCISPEWVQKQTWVPIELKAGQFVVFGPHLAHRSGTNKSSQDRKALYATYNWAKEGNLHQEYYEERAKLFPATHLRKEGEDYSEGEKIFGFGSPMLSLGLGKQREV